MLIEIPDNILNKSNLTENELKIEFALFLFNNSIMTLGQASNFANMDSFEFQKLLGERKISIHYDEKDLNDDLETIKRVFG
jgi:predicted HTH domain antitoxin